MSIFSKIQTRLNSQIALPEFLSPGLCILIFILVLLYIINRLNIEEDLRYISDLTKEIKELRYEQITTSSELMNMSRQSEVLRRVEAEGIDLKELTEPPRIISKK